MVQLGRYVSVARLLSIKHSILRIPSDNPRENQFRSSSEKGVKGVFFLLCGLVLFEFVSEFCKAFLLTFIHRIHKWRTRGKILVPSYESEALEDKQKLANEDFQ